MKHALVVLFSILGLASCATVSREQGLVQRAADATGTDAWDKNKTVAIKGTVKQWDPEQSDVPGGEQGNHATVIGHDGTVPFHRAVLTARRGESMGALESELGAHSWARLCSEVLSTGSLSTQHVRGDAWRTGSRELPPHERRGR